MLDFLQNFMIIIVKQLAVNDDPLYRDSYQILSSLRQLRGDFLLASRRSEITLDEYEKAKNKYETLEKAVKELLSFGRPLEGSEKARATWYKLKTLVDE